MKRIDERSLTRSFLNQINESHHEGGSHHDLDPDRDGVVSKEDLYQHFDLNGDGKVTTDEYKDHIEFHCKHPETLSHYNTLRSSSINNVNCKNSYDSCSKHLMSSPDGIEDMAYYVINGDDVDIEQHLKPLMDKTGATCTNSSMTAILDVLQSLVNCGIIS